MNSQTIRKWSPARSIYNYISKLPGYFADRQIFNLAARVESALEKVSHDPYHARRKNIYLRLEKIKTNTRRWNGQNGQQYPVFVINRDQDKDRFDTLDRRCRKLGIRLTRIEAIDSMSPGFDFQPYREFIPGTFWGYTIFRRGAIGCYLSHANVWKRMCESDVNIAIVLEDDVYPLIPFPQTINAFNLPPSFDVAFLSSSVGAWFAANGFPINPQIDQVDVQPFEAAVQQLLNLKDWLDSPGGYAYIISESGANKMLRILTESKICCGVDYAITLHSMSPSFRNHTCERLSEQQQWEISHIPFSDVKLETFVILPSLVDHRPHASIIDSNTLPKLIERSSMNI